VCGIARPNFEVRPKLELLEKRLGTEGEKPPRDIFPGLAGAVAGVMGGVVGETDTYQRPTHMPWDPELPDARGPKEGLAVPSVVAAAAVVGAGAAAAKRDVSPRPRVWRVIIVGDSIVTGVGCDGDNGQGLTVCSYCTDAPVHTRASSILTRPLLLSSA